MGRLGTEGDGIFWVIEVVEVYFGAVVYDIAFPIEGNVAIGELQVITVSGVIIGEVGEQSFVEHVIPTGGNGGVAPFHAKQSSGLENVIADIGRDKYVVSFVAVIGFGGEVVEIKLAAGEVIGQKGFCQYIDIGSSSGDHEA